MQPQAEGPQTDVSEEAQEELLEWIEKLCLMLEEADSPVSNPGAGCIYINAQKQHARTTAREGTVATLIFGGC